MSSLQTLATAGILIAAASLVSCVEQSQLNGTGTTPSASNAAATRADTPKLTQHDAALRFLTSYIRLDRNMALQFASPVAVSKLDWNRPHSGNIPYYDDKMILHFNGGWARVYFQQVGGSYRVSDLEVHRR